MPTSQNNSTDKRRLLSSDQPKSLWRNRDYLLLWSGQALSDIGGAVSELAFPLLVLAVTHSPAQAGFVAALRALPATLFSLLAGVLVDRWDRKWVMLACDAGRALSLASIPVAYALGHLTIWQLSITAFLEGTLMIVFKLAKTATVPQVVTRAQLTTAVAQEEFVISLRCPVHTGRDVPISHRCHFLSHLYRDPGVDSHTIEARTHVNPSSRVGRDR
jgi:Na+/melibiose symporter-like transporter